MVMLEICCQGSITHVVLGRRNDTVQYICQYDVECLCFLEIIDKTTADLLYVNDEAVIGPIDDGATALIRRS